MARVLRGHWFSSDWAARRLLRFLAGLALLAMAFAGPAATVPPPVAPSPAVTTASAETSVTLRESVSAPSAVRVEEGPASPEAPATIVVAALLVVLIGGALRVRGQRAPPAA